MPRFRPHLKQLQAFSAVIRTGATQAAANALNLSQPGISMLLQDLEANVGFPLFYRRGGRLVPTSEALEFVDRVNEALNVIDRLELFASDLKDMRVGSLRIASLVGPSLAVVPEALSGFSKDFPDVRIWVQTRTSEVVRDWVSSDFVDLGLSETCIDERSTIIREFDLECFLVMSKDNPLSEHRDLTPHDLANENLMTLNVDHPTSNQLKIAFESADLAFRPRIESYLFAPIVRMAGETGAIGIVDPLSFKAVNNWRTTLRRFRPRISMKLMLIAPRYRKLSRHAEKFLDYLVKTVEESEVEALAVAEGKSLQ